MLFKASSKDRIKVQIILILFAFLANIAAAEDTDHSQHHPKEQAPPKTTGGPLDKLEKALNKTPPRPTKAKTTKSKPAQMQKDKGGMSGGMMGMMDGMMGMMGKMAPTSGGMESPQQKRSELPGFPGASHLYHVGATGFFIDHQSMLDFTEEQIAKLKEIKKKSESAQSSFEEKLESAEEQMWTLTASDRPDIGSIENKAKEIEALKSEQRIAFIRDVGEAAKVLTAKQRAAVLGQDSAPESKGGM